MKHKLSLAILLAILPPLMMSCRDSSDNFLSSRYNEADDKYKHKEDHTCEGQFKAIWTTLNGLYPIWDYETDVDWDEVYWNYLDIFQKYDKRHQETGEVISDSTYRRLYVEILSQLHDGHLTASIWNPHTGTGSIDINIGEIRNEKEREDYFTRTFSCIDSYDEQLKEKDKSPDFSVLLFKDNIVYLRITSFLLSDNFDQTSVFYDTESAKNSRRVWNKWFDTIQELQNTGNLKGIIIDLRGNHGGNGGDYKYCLGALQPSDPDSPGYHRIGYLRYKTGTGRLDYSPLVPAYYPIYPEPHVVIDKEPIVVLCNCYTMSIAEMVCKEAKQMKNACVMGMRTWGALSPFIGSESILNKANGNLTGKIYSRFQIEIPDAAFITDEGEILEGKGVEPDIEVSFDRSLYDTFKRDSQIERALEYIRTGK